MTIMKAWRLPAYDSDPSKAIDSLTLSSDIPVPSTISPDLILLKIEYASVNPVDWKLFTGGVHASFPITSFPYTPGFDVAGTVQKVGSAVTDVSEGDKIVMNIGLVESIIDPPPLPLGPAGGFAQYVIVPAAMCCKVGADADLSVLVGLPLVGLTAYQGLFTGACKSLSGGELGRVGAGSKVLILGGSSTVGLFAIQLAKKTGAEVAVTASSNLVETEKIPKSEYVKKFGADIVIDYKTQDWGEVLKGKDYDLIYDCVGDQSDWTDRAPKVLKKGGMFCSIANFNEGNASTNDHLFALYFLSSDKKDLDTLLEMVEKGDVVIPVDSRYGFGEVKEALKRSMSGRAVGKIIVKIDH